MGRAGEGILNDGGKAFKHLYKKGSYKPEDLKTEKPYQKLIQSTFDVFDFAIEDNDMPEVMRTALQDDARLFGALKANAQLFEASKLLLNADGGLKPFSEVSRDFDKLNVNYNQNYLEAEYEFAVASSQAAAQWANLGGDRYNLQYRTAQDERVRASHQALADITLPKEDPFWNSFYPPNGWRCFLPETLVLTENGWQEIQNIKQRDWLIGGSGYMKFVEAVHTNSFNGNLVTLFAKGKQIACTPNHRFFTRNGWVMSADIAIGDILIQVGKVGFFNKIMNAVHNTKTLILYGLMSFKRKRKTV